MKNLRKLPLLLLVVTLFWSCSDDDDAATTTQPTPTTLNIVQTAQATPSLSLLVEAVIQTGLVDALSADGERTVLAPTNDAFQALLDSNMAWNTLADIDNAVLTQVLLNHVIDGANIESSALAGNTGYASTLASGPGMTNLSIFFNGNNGVTFNGSSNVAAADIATSNGIVHVVDTVIALPTLLTFATADPTFDSLEASVTLMGQAAVATALTNATTASPLTVLAPTNAAFTALLDSNMTWNGPADIDSALLTAVLTHHVTVGNVPSAALTNPGTTTAASVQGQDFSITLPGTNGNIADVTDGSANTDIGIIAVDVQASNGVIHAVNKVLLPM